MHAARKAQLIHILLWETVFSRCSANVSPDYNFIFTHVKSPNVIATVSSRFRTFLSPIILIVEEVKHRSFAATPYQFSVSQADRELHATEAAEEDDEDNDSDSTSAHPGDSDDGNSSGMLSYLLLQFCLSFAPTTAH